jgi:hypothetical protein
MRWPNFTVALALSFAACAGDRLPGSKLDTAPEPHDLDSLLPDSELGADTPDTDRDDADPDAGVPDTGVPDTEPDMREPTVGVIVTDPVATTDLLPGSVLQLDVVLPTELDDDVEQWRWSVIQPPGSATTFLPDATVRSPTFELWVIGTYTFQLEYLDGEGRSRFASEAVVTVTPTDDFHVQLTWHTPGDPDESDTGGEENWSAGSDVDLHLLHPNARGVFFHEAWDCHFWNLTPDWGAPGPDNDPFLDRDDTDGAGPEVISVERPENVRYRVGVHYWNPWGFGVSFATVRIYIRGVLAEEWANVELAGRDLWESHDIDWPGGFVTRLYAQDGGPLVGPSGFGP